MRPSGEFHLGCGSRASVLGVRQSSGAFDGPVMHKAVEGHRTPRHWRVCPRSFLIADAGQLIAGPGFDFFQGFKRLVFHGGIGGQ
jgi:hypothetical protein